MSYGLIKGLFGAAVLRTYSAIGMLRDNSADKSLFAVCALGTASYFLLLLVEGVEKRRLYQMEYSVSLLLVGAMEAKIELVSVILEGISIVIYHPFFVLVVAAFIVERTESQVWIRRSG